MDIRESLPQLTLESKIGDIVMQGKIGPLLITEIGEGPGDTIRVRAEYTFAGGNVITLYPDPKP